MVLVCQLKIKRTTLPFFLCCCLLLSDTYSSQIMSHSYQHKLGLSLCQTPQVKASYPHLVLDITKSAFYFYASLLAQILAFFQ
jgi:hypothetical protein